MTRRQTSFTAALVLLGACSGDPADTDATASETATATATTTSTDTDADTSTTTTTTGETESASATEPTSTTEAATDTEGTTDTGAVDPVHEMICQQLGPLVDVDESYAVPGVAGAPRWGIPMDPPNTPRIRRSWSSLDAAGKQQVIWSRRRAST